MRGELRPSLGSFILEGGVMGKLLVIIGFIMLFMNYWINDLNGIILWGFVTLISYLMEEKE